MAPTDEWGRAVVVYEAGARSLSTSADVRLMLSLTQTGQDDLRKAYG
ncbi:MAG: hypothetical protein QOF09_3023 [Alphaproteobacteria bacterium]|jgi:hypothetical protein|nr:hypothetical protein [Alphaproteobacteria bacterium]